MDNLLPKLLLIGCLLSPLCLGSLLAQTPANDECTGAVDLGKPPFCPSAVFSNVGATFSTISSTPADNIPKCFVGGVAQRDVWFVFTCPDDQTGFRLTVSGVNPGGLRNPQVATYRGECGLEGLAEFYCASAEPGETEVFVDLPDLSKGEPYFIRVSDFSSTAVPNAGNFTLCLEPIPPDYRMGDPGSTLCKGVLFDSGGPTAPYSDNENHVFTICPSTPPPCLEFTLDYYQIEPGNELALPLDLILFFDGKDTLAPLIGLPIGGDLDEDGGGGVLYKVQAASGCLTVQFKSNAALPFEGFKGRWACRNLPCQTTPPIAVDTAISEAALEAFLETPFSNVSGAKIKCTKGAYGNFQFPTVQNDVGLERGLILTSGRARNVFNPGEAFANHRWRLPGDDDLDYLSTLDGNALRSADACVVEVDVFVASDELSFDYVFGSEEYPEYVFEDYNDIFAFLVSGPGIVGDPAIRNQRNIAVLPGTNTPIQIDNVNQLVNWPYYRDNRLGLNIVYDGMTADSFGRRRYLTARTPVTPCNTYHLKFAVADRYDVDFGPDFSYDSGVFIANVQGGGPEAYIAYGSGIDYFIENCSGRFDTLFIELAQPKNKAVTYFVHLEGSATVGLDYRLDIPSVITFQPGQTRLAFPIEALSDNLVESTEKIIIRLTGDFGCDEVVFSTVVADLRDNVAVRIEGPDSLRVCQGGALPVTAVGGLDYFWQPPGLVSNPYIADPMLMPTQSRWFKVSGKISDCEQSDSVFVTVVVPTLEVEALGNVVFCLGDSVRLQTTDNLGHEGLIWSPALGLNDPTAPDPWAKPTNTTTYTAALDIPGCSIQRSLTLTVDTLFFPTIPTDVYTCLGEPVRLGNLSPTTNTYQWIPSQGLDNPNAPSPWAQPAQTTTYTLTAQTRNKGCSRTASVTVHVTDLQFNIGGPDSLVLCAGDSLRLGAVASQGNLQSIEWAASDGTIYPTGSSLGLRPTQSVSIFAAYTVDGCTVRDSVRIAVDSLPYRRLLETTPSKPLYCPGDTVRLSSPPYLGPNFPNLQHEWASVPGMFEPLSGKDMGWVAQTTRLFQRVRVNGVCRDTQRLLVQVGQRPLLQIQNDVDTLCPGQQVLLSAQTDPPGEQLLWSPTQGLSCANCPNPTARPNQSTTYHVVTALAACPARDSVYIYVGTPPVLALPADLTLCPEVDTLLLLNVAPSQVGVRYQWVSDPPGFTSNLAQPRDRPLATTRYRLKAQGDCTLQEDVLVTVVAPTKVQVGPDQTICNGQSVQLQAQSMEPGAFVWQDGATGPVRSVAPDRDSLLWVVFQNSIGCRARDTINITVRPPYALEAMAEPNRDTLCDGEILRLRMLSLSPAGTPLRWTVNGQAVQSFGDTLVETSLVFASGGDNIHRYAVRTANPYGCPDAEQFWTFYVDPCFALPNAFTPNGDGTNDAFGPLLFESAAKVLVFEVYNRWGEKVFSPQNRAVPRWDGTLSSGEPAPMDTYVYFLKIQRPNGKTDVYRGDVALIR